MENFGPMFNMNTYPEFQTFRGIYGFKGKFISLILQMVHALYVSTETMDRILEGVYPGRTKISFLGIFFCKKDET